MGLLRLVLATLVLISHLGISFGGLNPGVSAVIVFYMLAGHVVSQLWARRPQTGGQRWFYLDRLWRIFPLYATAALLSIGLWLAGAQSYFFSKPPGLTDWLANLLIIPLNFYMYSGQDAFTLVPPAWSLGAELQFYLLIPFLLGRPWLAIGAAALSFGVFVLAQLNLVDSDVYGYRLLAGVGFIFLAGTLLGRTDRLSRGALALLWASSVAYVVWLRSGNHYLPFNTEVALGVVVGLPMLAAFLYFPRKGMLHRLQRRGGELSYGVFLFHFPVIWLLQLFGFSGPSTAPAVIALSILLAWLAHILVERPLWKYFRLELAASSTTQHLAPQQVRFPG